MGHSICTCQMMLHQLFCPQVEERTEDKASSRDCTEEEQIHTGKRSCLLSPQHKDQHNSQHSHTHSFSRQMTTESSLHLKWLSWDTHSVPAHTSTNTHMYIYSHFAQSVTLIVQQLPCCTPDTRELSILPTHTHTHTYISKSYCWNGGHIS